MLKWEREPASSAPLCSHQHLFQVLPHSTSLPFPFALYCKKTLPEGSSIDLKLQVKSKGGWKALSKHTVQFQDIRE